MNSLVIAATRVLSGPQIPARNRNGKSIRSKNRTNSARSWAISAPSTALSATAKNRKNCFGCSHSRNAAQTRHTKKMNAARAIKNRFNPSMPSL